MIYRTLGRTGFKSSILGFGAMRLPTFRKDDKEYINREETISMIRYAIDHGVNYVDTAYVYHHQESEIVVGKALEDGYRDKVALATKIPLWNVKKAEDYHRFLDEQLKKLQTSCIDFFLMHALNKNLWKKVLDLDLMKEAEKAKSEGKIKHSCFSFHDEADLLKTIIDTDHFDLMLVQYNILDRTNQEMMEYAQKKDIGVVVMGPVGGGRLSEPSPVIQEWMPESVQSTTDMALRFVFSNPTVGCALSGMGSMEMVKENLASAEKDALLTDDELTRIDAFAQKFANKSELLCTQCKYCMPCPNEVNIPIIFKQLAYAKVYQIPEFAKNDYKVIGTFHPGKNASECIQCGECEPKCPQHIPIMQQLEEAHEMLTT